MAARPLCHCLFVLLVGPPDHEWKPAKYMFPLGWQKAADMHSTILVNADLSPEPRTRCEMQPTTAVGCYVGFTLIVKNSA